MKTQNIFILVILIITSTSVFSQSHNYRQRRYHQHFHRELLVVGDDYYTPSYRGIKYFMNDLQLKNPDLHLKLTPAYKTIVRKKTISNVTLTSSAIVGSILFIGGATFMRETITIGSSFHPDGGISRKMSNVQVMQAGVGIYAIGSIIAYLVHPRNDDYYHFINLHNHYSPGEKMDFRISLNSENYNDIGLKLTMNLY